MSPFGKKLYGKTPGRRFDEKSPFILFSVTADPGLDVTSLNERIRRKRYEQGSGGGRLLAVGQQAFIVFVIKDERGFRIRYGKSVRIGKADYGLFRSIGNRGFQGVCRAAADQDIFLKENVRAEIQHPAGIGLQCVFSGGQGIRNIEVVGKTDRIAFYFFGRNQFVFPVEQIDVDIVR